MPEGRIAWFWLFAAGKRTNSRHDFWYGKNNKIVVLCIYIFDGGGESPFRIMKKNFIFLVCAFLCLGTFLGSCKDGGESDGGNSGFPEHLAEYLGDKSYKSPKNVEISKEAAENQSAGLKDNWWRETSFYHIWVKSFADSDGDDCGDFKGIEKNLDYIQNDLGCSGIWLSPIFECDYKSKAKKENMHGYDVKDYYAVNSFFGTEDDLISLINACHEKNIKIIFDFVPNHTGKGNEWFSDSCADKNSKKDWYLWSDTELSWDPGMGSADTWHKNPSGNDYYYAAFWEGQPDLNFRNYEVREEMKNVVRYWLNKGFDGLRVDAVRYLIETENSKYDTDETHEWFAELRKDVVDEYKTISPKFMVCEAWITNDRARLEKYFGTDEKPEFNMVFDFDQGYGAVNGVGCGDAGYLSSSLRKNPAENKSYGTFVGNHDNYIDRLGTFYDGYEAMIKAATAMSLLRPSVPFIYYGQEIGMKDDTLYGFGDIRYRTAIDWNEVKKQKTNPSSILKFNKALLALRNKYKNLFANGNVEFLETRTVDEKEKPLNTVVAYTISDGTDSLLCVQSLINNSYPFWFEKSSSVDISNYSVLIGINDEKNLSIDKGCLKIKSIAPYETRVYYLGDSSKKMLFTDNRLFLRGDMNNWGYYEMEYNSENQSFSVSVELKAATYQFKFDKYCDWNLSYGSGEENKNGKAVSLGEMVPTSAEEGEATNFAVTISKSGKYLFTFNEADNLFSVR